MKTTLITLGLTLSVISSAHAHDLASELRACQAKTDSALRMACYDQLSTTNSSSQTQAPIASPPSVQTPPPSAKVPATKPVAAENQVSRDTQIKNFGLAKVIEPEDKVQKVSTSVTDASKDPYGKLIVTLENGQVWRQTSNSTLRIKTGDQIYVEEGMLGAYFLSKESSNKRIRVKRSK
ncbi:hypothetical protein [Paraglaciecola polaris]|uniref:Type IV pilus biogenesis protein PilP n=1 Tax=Paraglaciecola polaris LMG 21857 TaxID=1129793 RepID=K7AC83_9ALTE|nr:hypothetical protein [Paraglaciecola polaris]GAC32960.1 hypothetical protein GPLA_2055 [Paraglaciecola polaris LMG 21857]|tara:strand:+ start:458 stop:994 length:537 start_codon:yes stop_codon:yes gene_type:complete